MQTLGTMRYLGSLAALLAGIALCGPAAANMPVNFAPQTPNASSAATPDQTYPAILIIPTSKTSPTDESANLDQTICKIGPPPTGTRLGGSRECHTAREWDDRQQEQWGQLTHMQLTPVPAGFSLTENQPGRVQAGP